MNPWLKSILSLADPTSDERPACHQRLHFGTEPAQKSSENSHFGCKNMINISNLSGKNLIFSSAQVVPARWHPFFPPFQPLPLAVDSGLKDRTLSAGMGWLGLITVLIRLRTTSHPILISDNFVKRPDSSR